VDADASTTAISFRTNRRDTTLKRRQNVSNHRGLIKASRHWTNHFETYGVVLLENGLAHSFDNCIAAKIATPRVAVTSQRTRKSLYHVNWPPISRKRRAGAVVERMCQAVFEQHDAVRLEVVRPVAAGFD